MNLRDVVLTVLLTAFLCSPLFLFSKPEGNEIDPRSTGYLPFPGEISCGDAECHNVTPNSGLGGVNISINGQPASEYSYNPGETVPVMVTISEPSPDQIRFGFQMTARTPDGCSQAGTFSIGTDPNIFLLEDAEAMPPCMPEMPELIQFPTHSFAKPRLTGTVPITYEVNWTAPATDIGPIVFAAAGNAANGDDEETGDNIYTTNATVGPAPTHEVGGVFNAASFLPMISPGGIAAVGGSFAETSAESTTVPLSLDLGGFSVTFDGQPGALFVVAGDDQGLGFNQANVQVPHTVDVTDGKISVQVHWEDESGTISSAPFEADAAPASPGIFSFEFGPGRGIVQNLDGPFAQPVGSLGGIPARPALIGDFVIVWCHGLGPLDFSPVGGELATGDIPGFDNAEPPNPILLLPTKEVRVFVGGVRAQVVVPFLHPTLVALNQVNVQIPNGVEPGDQVSIVIEVDCGNGEVFRSREDVTIAVSAT